MRTIRAIDESMLNILSRIFGVSKPPSDGFDLDDMPTLPNPGQLCGAADFYAATSCFVTPQR
jgi:hypothetical protein